MKPKRATPKTLAEKGLALMLNGGVHPLWGGVSYRVDSSSQDLSYQVDVGSDGSYFCQCAGHAWQHQKTGTFGLLCRHCHAVQAYKAAIERARRKAHEIGVAA